MFREGHQREARECFQRCVDVTPEMALEVIRACQMRNVDCLVAPYESDAQLAHLCNQGLADLVISEVIFFCTFLYLVIGIVRTYKDRARPFLVSCRTPT